MAALYYLHFLFPEDHRPLAQVCITGTSPSSLGSKLSVADKVLLGACPSKERHPKLEVMTPQPDVEHEVPGVVI